MLNLDLRSTLTRRFGVKRWMLDDEEVAKLAAQVRERMRLGIPSQGRGRQ